MTSPLAALWARHALPGPLEWIGLHPALQKTTTVPERVEIHHAGLIGDRRPAPAPRAVGLAELRRDLLVSRLNLIAPKHPPLRIGGAVLRITPPRAVLADKAALGPGGYNAIRGHGG